MQGGAGRKFLRWQKPVQTPGDVSAHPGAGAVSKRPTTLRPRIGLDQRHRPLAGTIYRHRGGHQRPRADGATRCVSPTRRTRRGDLTTRCVRTPPWVRENPGIPSPHASRVRLLARHATTNREASRLWRRNVFRQLFAVVFRQPCWLPVASGSGILRTGRRTVSAPHAAKTFFRRRRPRGL